MRTRAIWIGVVLMLGSGLINSAGVGLSSAEANTSMPDKCENNLHGKWQCGVLYNSLGNISNVQYHYTISSTIDEDGYEHISMRIVDPSWIGGYDITQEWKVDEKWHPNLLRKDKNELVAVTCDGTNKKGYKILVAYYKEPDGSDRSAMKYFVDSRGRMQRERYKVWWVGDTMHQKRLFYDICLRES